MKTNPSTRIIALIAACLSTACQSVPQVKEPQLVAYGHVDHVEVRRLLPGDDLRLTLEAWAKTNSVKAASIVSAVGSLKQASLRFADQKDVSILTGPFEIVSLTGLIADSGVHLHAAISDKTGKTLGGHLGEGSIVYTTMELVIGVYRDIEFLREQDTRTGFKELFLQKK